MTNTFFVAKRIKCKKPRDLGVLIRFGRRKKKRYNWLWAPSSFSMHLKCNPFKIYSPILALFFNMTRQRAPFRLHTFKLLSHFYLICINSTDSLQRNSELSQSYSDSCRKSSVAKGLVLFSPSLWDRAKNLNLLFIHGEDFRMTLFTFSIFL